MKKHYTQFALALLGAAVASTALLACTDQVNIVYIHDPNEGEGGSSADSGADAAEDANDAGPSTDGGQIGCTTPCEGSCRPTPPDGFSPVRLVWFGADESSAPACPPHASEQETIVHADLSVPATTCVTCTCGPSEGSCALPERITAHSGPCENLEGTLALSTDPPDSWAGQCTGENPIPQGILCGGLPCVQSVRIDPLTMTNESCAPSQPSTEPLPAPSWQLTAKMCEGSALGTCDPGEECAPGNAEGFRPCIERLGIFDCPTEGFTDRFVYFDGYSDTRQCSPCTCGAPTGSVCTAWLSLYQDSACTGLAVHAKASSEKHTCQDVSPSAFALGGKSADAPVYSSGVCQAGGGELMGEVSPTDPRTFCCLPS